MKKILILLIPTLFLTACLTNKPDIQYRETKVEVAVLPPVPPKLDKPVLPVDSLPANAPDKDTATAYWSSILILENAIDLRDAELDKIRNFKLTPTDTTNSGTSK